MESFIVEEQAELNNCSSDCRSPDYKQKNDLVYRIDQTPPFHLTVVFAFQQILLSMSSTIILALVVADQICAKDHPTAKAEILATSLVICGITTLLQNTVGVRLPIIQGGCHKFIPAIVALMSLEKWACPSSMSTTDFNITVSNYSNCTHDAGWKLRMREIQGGVMVASITQVVIGCTGLLGFIMNFVGPLTIMPTISLVGISVFNVALGFAQQHWGIASMTIVLMLLFSLYMSKLQVPFFIWNKKKGCHVIRYPVFKLLPVILSVAISWIICGILTHFGVFPDDPSASGYGARVDASISALYNAKWFFAPYPGQWGTPTVSFASFSAMLAVTFASIIESVGDYYAAARASFVAPPPPHAINRGISIEGVCSILAGAFGSGAATTSYSQNIGAIGFTKVASRRVFQVAGVLFILAGVFGKFGALLTMMPVPVLGGVITLTFGMVISIGLSTLQFVDLTSSRNHCIIGFSMMMGLMLPSWVKNNQAAIDTGLPEFDQAVRVMLNTGMFVGGVVGFFLDNTVPGTAEERGIIKWRENVNKDDTPSTSNSVYDLPYITGWLKSQKWSRYVPILPTYTPFTSKKLCIRRT